jgi:hypothetical protein
MNLTKRQKMLLGVFLVGLVALVVDRVLLRPQGGAAVASAASGESVAELAVPAPNVPALPAQPQGQRAARCLERLWSEKNTDFEHVRNPFSLPASWPTRPGKAVNSTPDAGALFAARHQLTAVVIDTPESYVLIDGRLLRPGQTVDGFELVSVGDRSAVFERAGTRVTLEIVSQ